MILSLNREGLTVLLVEHDLRLAMALAQDILVIDGGRCIAHGPVRRDSAVIAGYLGPDA